MEVYLNLAETGIGTYGANAGAQRYFGHDASAMSATEAARIAAVLPLPKKRGAIAPKGFTRRYGNTISARIGEVRRDGLDACVYAGATAPKDKAPPPSKAPRELPGEEYETATPPPPEASVDATPVEEPSVLTDPNAVEATPDLVPDEPMESPPANEIVPAARRTADLANVCETAGTAAGPQELMAQTQEGGCAMATRSANRSSSTRSRSRSTNSTRIHFQRPKRLWMGFDRRHRRCGAGWSSAGHRRQPWPKILFPGEERKAGQLGR